MLEIQRSESRPDRERTRGFLKPRPRQALAPSEPPPHEPAGRDSDVAADAVGRRLDVTA
jgi:hypothetical protein